MFWEGCLVRPSPPISPPPCLHHPMHSHHNKLHHRWRQYRTAPALLYVVHCSCYRRSGGWYWKTTEAVYREIWELMGCARAKSDFECCDDRLANCLRPSIGINGTSHCIAQRWTLQCNAMFLHPGGLDDRTRPSRSYHWPLSQHHDATGPIWSECMLVSCIVFIGIALHCFSVHVLKSGGVQCSSVVQCSAALQCTIVHTVPERSLVAGLSDVRLMVALPLSTWAQP